jgi:hypothetical protein
MKLLLVADDEIMKTSLLDYTDSNGGSIIHYKHPLKSMDNFNEIEPDVVLFSSMDYPRHWKIAAKMLRETRNRKSTLFILLINESFPAEEADKAAYLGVNALLTSEELNENNFNRLAGLINRYRIKPERMNGPVFHNLTNPCPMIFMNPENLQFVSGRIVKELANRMLFSPSEPAAIAPIEKGMLIRNCSLERDNAIETFDVMVKQSGEYLELEKLEQNVSRGIA